MWANSTIDYYEMAIFVGFSIAILFGLYDIRDAWYNQLAVLKSRNSVVALMGFVDFLVTVLLVFSVGVPGVVMAGVLFTTVSAIQRGDATPQQLTVAAVTRVGLLMISFGLVAACGLSFWLRQELARQRAEALERAGKAAPLEPVVVESPVTVVTPGTIVGKEGGTE